MAAQMIHGLTAGESARQRAHIADVIDAAIGNAATPNDDASAASATTEEEEGDFQDPGYWDDFYDDGEQYDWYSAAGAVFAAARREMRRVERATGRPARVLDVGCGTATHLAELGAFGAVTGVDFSPRVVEACRASDPEGRATYVCADALDLPFEAGSFDVVLDKGCLDCFVSSETARYAPRDRYLCEVARVLGDGGVFVVTSVCGADVVSLLSDGVANRCAEATAGATRPPADAWEVARSPGGGGAIGGSDAGDQRFDVLQIVARRARSTSSLRAPRAGAAGDDGAARASTTRATPTSTTRRRRASRSPTASSLRAARRRAVSDLLPIPDGGRAVPKARPGCGAGVRRFAMS
ncbi:ubiE/COQ5 methyltransferase [Aureococcus anophagefferens]|uniref:UbiE/COQ5 methyltransferase n=1 Tax=Aureococcus anophagefferens TaxID=44056 RepID=A0ABR1G8C7_AURAN